MIITKQFFEVNGVCSEGLRLLDTLMNGEPQIEYKELFNRLVKLEGKFGKQWVINNLFYPQEFIGDLKEAREYMGIIDCENCFKSQNLYACFNVFQSSNLQNCSYVKNCENLVNCHFCADCFKSQNLLFCSKTTNFCSGDYAICNIKVNERRFKNVLNLAKKLGGNKQNILNFVEKLPEFKKSKTFKKEEIL